MRFEEKHQAGLKHLAAGRLNSAETCLRAVVAANPKFAEAHYNLGCVLRERLKLTGAAHAFRTAIACAPEMAVAHAALGSTLQRLSEAAAAEASARRAAALDPSLVLAQVLLADILRDLGRIGEAHEVYARAIRLAPDEADARFGRGFLNLLEGDYAHGLIEYEFRPSRRGSSLDPLQPQWRGEDLSGKTLLLYGEQGIGDSIQFLRYVPMLAAKGARIVLAVHPSLMTLASAIEGIGAIIQPGSPTPAFDVCCPLPSLPLYCGTRLDNIPFAGGYLAPSAGQADRWRTRLEDSAELTVALAWAGNPDHPNDHNRSATLADIAPLLQLEGVRWLVLQPGTAGAELGRRRAGGIVNLGPELADFSDTAAIVSCADLVISVDTALCHLAGALGRPTWTMLPFAPDWRWLAKGRTTPWYSAMRLYRQSKPGDWAGVVADLTRDLTAAREAKAG